MYQYLDTLDEKRRQWEEKKYNYYKSTGKTYVIPGEEKQKDKDPKDKGTKKKQKKPVADSTKKGAIRNQS